jgi:hypothetical protein
VKEMKKRRMKRNKQRKKGNKFVTDGTFCRGLLTPVYKSADVLFLKPRSYD